MSMVNAPRWGVFLWLIFSLGLGDLVVTFYRTEMSGVHTFLISISLVFTFKSFAYDIKK